MGTGTSIEHRQQPTALLPPDSQHAKHLGLIAAQLTKLAVMMGEPMDSGGLRLRLMAEEISDLSADSVQYAITAWSRGDISALSSYQQDHVRVGSFFPKPAELRALAKVFLRKKRIHDEERKREEEDDAQQRHRREHPEMYCSWGDIFTDVKERRRVVLLDDQAKSEPPSPTCPHCGGFVATTIVNFTPADLRLMADVRERQLAMQAEAQKPAGEIIA